MSLRSTVVSFVVGFALLGCHGQAKEDLAKQVELGQALAPHQADCAAAAGALTNFVEKNRAWVSDTMARGRKAVGAPGWRQLFSLDEPSLTDAEKARIEEAGGVVRTVRDRCLNLRNGLAWKGAPPPHPAFQKAWSELFAP